MAKTKLRKYYLNKEKAIEDFGSVGAVIKEFELNWKKTLYGVDNIKHFNGLSREYILERDTTPQIFVETKVDFVDSKEKATHILKDYKGGVICKRVLG